MDNLTWYRDLAIILYQVQHADDKPKVTDAEIAKAFGLTKGRVSQILNMPYGEGARELNIYFTGVILKARIVEGFDRPGQPYTLDELAEDVRELQAGRQPTPPFWERGKKNAIAPSSDIQ